MDKNIETQSIKFNNFIDSLDEKLGLSLFQIALIKEINFFVETQGAFIFIKKHYYKKYSSIISAEEIDRDVLDLIEKGFIFEKKKKTIYNCSYVTNTYLESNVTNKKLPFSGQIISRLKNNKEDAKELLKYILTEFYETFDEYNKLMMLEIEILNDIVYDINHII